MCPKMADRSSNQLVDNSSDSFVDRVKSKFGELHRITVAAIVLYSIFVVVFIITNVLMCVWNVKINGKRPNPASKRCAERVDEVR